MPVVHLTDVTAEMIKSLQYIYNRGLISYIKTQQHMEESFLDYLNQIDSTGKIKFPIQVQDEDGIEFLDLKLKLENSKVAVEVFAKHTKSFIYVLPTSCYPRKSVNNIPRGIALRLRGIL